MIMESVKSPFILNLSHAFQDAECIYLLSPLINGGSFKHLVREHAPMDASAARVYAAEIVLALEAMHRRDFAYNDLSLDNILVDTDGHLKLFNFGDSERMTPESLTMTMSTSEYVAPEQVEEECSPGSADFWSLGVVICQMLTKKKPFRPSKNHPNFDPPIYSGAETLPESAKALLDGLLHREPGERLGAAGFDALKSHVFFDGVDWAAVEAKGVKPPFPCSQKISAGEKSRLFRDIELVGFGSRKSKFKLSEIEQRRFRLFDYNTKPSKIELSVEQPNGKRHSARAVKKLLEKVEKAQIVKGGTSSIEKSGLSIRNEFTKTSPLNSKQNSGEEAMESSESEDASLRSDIITADLVDREKADSDRIFPEEEEEMFDGDMFEKNEDYNFKQEDISDQEARQILLEDAEHKRDNDERATRTHTILEEDASSGKPAAEDPAAKEPVVEESVVEEHVEKPAAEELAVEEKVPVEDVQPAAKEVGPEKPVYQNVQPASTNEVGPEKPVYQNVQPASTNEVGPEKPVSHNHLSEEPIGEISDDEEIGHDDINLEHEKAASDEKPADEQPADEKPTDEHLADENLVADSATAEEPAVEKPAVEEPVTN
eukprot:252066_1